MSRIDDLIEIAPGEWATAAEAEKLKAKATVIADLNARKRNRTIEDIPDLGTPVEFWAVIVFLFLLAYFFR